ncbi:MAG: hypothetical protein CSA05_02770 [Bacteroidia bacterium]|nr:MAG: hypothetical protein CSA05_02770 [Bacteroidia bacterium]
MKKLEDIIRENKELFDTFEPESNHFDRFEQKLNKQNMRKNKYSFNFYFKIASFAAMLVLVVMLTWKFYKENYEKTASPQYKNVVLSDVSDEYKEVEMYLKSNVNDKIDEFENISCTNADFQIDNILKELKELDETYKELQQELKENGNDQRIIDAMIDCYQNKIELLNRVISQVNKNC